MKEKQKRGLFLKMMLLYSLATGITALLVNAPSACLSGLLHILTSPAQLTLDYFEIGCVGGTFLNAALVGMSCTSIFVISGAEISGTSLMAFFLTLGFSFFGMNFLNIWPCMLGTWLFAKVSGEGFAAQANVALFSTAFSPFVSEAIWRYPAFDGMTGAIFLRLLLAMLSGGIAGFLMPALCRHSPNMHRGYTLYNAAMVAGFIGIALFSLMYRAAGIEIPTNTDIGGAHSGIVNGFMLVVSLVTMLTGLTMNGWKVTCIDRILKSDGFGCDFTRESDAAVLVHMGLFGLLVTAYYNLIGTALNGPVLGSMLCMLAIAPCGAHALNVLPIMLGYALAAATDAIELSATAMAVGVSFACALCPIVGRFGIVSGMLAGMLHACMVTSVVAFHGGFCLYNGGFIAGIIAVLLVPVLEYFFEPTKGLRLLPKRRRMEKKVY